MSLDLIPYLFYAAGGVLALLLWWMHRRD